MEVSDYETDRIAGALASLCEERSGGQIRGRDLPVAPALGELVAALAGTRDGRVLAIEAVREGDCCHRARPRRIEAEDPDLALLAGDLLYAIGLEAVASVGESGPVAVLSDLIATSAQLDPAVEAKAFQALWLGQTVALGAGSGDGHSEALGALVRGEDPEGESLLEWAVGRASGAGAGEAFGSAAQSLQFPS